MGSDTPYPHHNDFEPLLRVDSTVELQPSIGTFGVEIVEVLPTIETQEFTVDANDTVNEAEMRSLYAQDGTLAQYRLVNPDTGEAIPDGVEITVDQGGEEAPRFNNKNRRGFYDNDTVTVGDAAQQTELFQYEDTDLFFNVRNTTGSQVTFTLSYSGWVYKLRPTDLQPQQTDVSVTVERPSLRR